jgi:hypothetical protein
MSDLIVFNKTKHSAAIRTETVDIAAHMPSGVTLSSATIAAAELPTLTDRSATVLQSTTCTTSGTNISYIAKAGTNGVTYKLTITPVLSNSDRPIVIVYMTIKDA